MPANSIRDKDIRDITDDQLRRTFQTNIFGDVLPDPGGPRSILQGEFGDHKLHVGDDVRRDREHLLDYSATKGAITAFTRSLALQPGEARYPRERGRARADLDSAQPVRRTAAGEIQSSARRRRWAGPASRTRSRPAFLFLACEDSSYMTAQVLHPDGGDTTSS